MQKIVNALPFLRYGARDAAARFFAAWWRELDDVFRAALRRGRPNHDSVVVVDRPAEPERHPSAAGRHVRVLLPRECVMRLPMALPAQALAGLREATRYQLLSASPLPLDEIYFDVQVCHYPRKRSERASVMVWLSRKDEVDQIAERLRQAGAASVCVGFAEQDVKRDCVFLKIEDEDLRERRKRSGVLLLWLMATIPLACASIYLSARFNARAEEARLRDLELKTSASLATQQRLGEAAAIRVQLARQSAAPRLSNVLEEVAIHLPEKAWVASVTAKDGRIVLRGYAAQPSALVAGLENVRQFEKVRLGSVAADGATPGFSSFEAVAELRAEAGR